MSLSWLLFLAAAIALVAPLPAAYRLTHRYRTLEELDIERRNASWWPTWRQVLRFSGHWFEFARGLCAGLGVLLTIDDVGVLLPISERHTAWANHLAPVGLALVGVSLIVVLFRQPGRAVAPIPYVAGAVLAVLPPQVSIPALVLAGASAFTMRSLGAFFGILSVALALIGLLLDRQMWPSAAGAVLAFTPLLFAFGLQREFVVAVRRSRSGS